MSKKAKRSALDRRYADIKQSLISLGHVVVRDVHDRHSSGILEEADDQEMLRGAAYLIQGLEAFLTDADSLMISAGVKKDVVRLVGHARALIGGSLFVARHINITETAEKFAKKQQTRPANLGNEAKRDERLELLRPILDKAERNEKGNFVKAKDLLRTLNQAIAEANSLKQVRNFDLIMSVQTLRRYARALDKSLHDDIESSRNSSD